MSRRFSTLFLPDLATSDNLTDRVVVVTDVLRATSTIITALENGATRVIPAVEIPEALARKTALGADCVLGGERGGVIIDGFHYGNSPREFTPEVIAGKTLVLCTTNGTRALAHCRAARQILIGAFINLSTVAQTLADEQDVTVVCSGTNRRITSEDVLFAGALAARLLECSDGWQICDQAAIAYGYWRSFVEATGGMATALATELGKGAGGRNLLRLGYHDDIAFCADIDRIPRLARFNVASWDVT